VLEHYEPLEIHSILSKQLNLARNVVFSVPTDSRFNRQWDANDEISRNLWPAGIWLSDILKPFRILEAVEVHTTRDELLVRLGAAAGEATATGQRLVKEG